MKVVTVSKKFWNEQVQIAVDNYISHLKENVNPNLSECDEKTIRCDHKKLVIHEFSMGLHSTGGSEWVKFVNSKK